MNGPLRILHLEDDRLDAELLKRLLARENLVREWVRVESSQEFLNAINTGPFDLILSDYTLPSFNGMEALALAREHYRDVPFIFVSGTIDENVAVESLKQGAADYVFKNRLSRLAPAVRRALRAEEERAESRRAEESMRESERKYRQVFESMNEAALVLNLPSGRVLDANQRAESLLGLARAEIIGAKHQRFLAPEKFGACLERLQEVFEKNKRIEVESEIIRKDGGRIPILIRASPLELYGHHLVLCLCSDITSRKQIQSQLREQSRLLDLLSEAVLVGDLEGHIRVWNDAATVLYGWSREEALGRKITELILHDGSEYETAIREALQRGEWHGELHEVDKANHEIIVRSRWSVVLDEHNQPSSILIVNIPEGQPAVNRLENIHLGRGMRHEAS